MLNTSHQYILDRYLSQPEGDQDQPAEDNLYTERVPQWSVEDVCQWLQQTGFTEYCHVFRQVGVDGDLLLPLKEKEMKEDLDMSNGIVRRRFLRELRNLKKISDYSCVDAEDIAEFLASIQPDFREYTYNLHKKDMTVEYMVKLSREDLIDMLKDAGVENMVHQHMIFDSVMTSPLEFPSSCSSSSSESSRLEVPYDVYLTCPVSRGAELCALIRIQLELRGITVHQSSDQDTGPPHLPQRSVKLIQDTKHFVLVLPKDSLDLVLATNTDPDNKIRTEIVTALQAGVNIIPVTDHGFQWLAREDMLEEVRDVPSYNSVRWVHEYQDACINKLEKFIRGGDNQLKVDSPYLCRSLARSRQSSGRSTPSIMSRKSSANPLAYNLLVPRNISLRKSSLSLYSNDSGLDNL